MSLIVGFCKIIMVLWSKAIGQPEAMINSSVAVVGKAIGGPEDEPLQSKVKLGVISFDGLCKVACTDQFFEF